MNFRIYFCLAIVLLSAGCNEQKGTLPEIVIPEDISRESENIDPILASAEYVPLETTPQSQIREISYIEVFHDTILIADYQLGRVHLFKRSGAYLTTLSHLGKGPREYIAMSDVSYDQKTGVLSLLDLPARQIKMYDLRDNFLGVVELVVENAGYSFERLNGYYVFYRSNNVFPRYPDHNIVVADSAQHYVTSGAVIPDAVKDLSLRSYKNTDIDNNVLYINAACNDTLFALAPSHRLEPVYRFRFPEDMDVKESKLWTRKYASKLELHEKAFKSNKVMNINKLIVAGKNVLFEFYANGRVIGIYDTERLDLVTFHNPRFSSHDISLNVIGKDDKAFIAQVGAGEQYERLNALTAKEMVKDFSNPVLLFFTLKN